MKISTCVYTLAVLAAVTLSATRVNAQNDSAKNALQGLAPVSALQNSTAGRAALARNLKITGDIQHGTAHQPNLLPFPEQQQQALRDAFITRGNASQLADGLGSTLGGIYQSLTTYTSSDDGKTSKLTDYTNISPTIAKLIAFANATTGADSAAGKCFFANATSPTTGKDAKCATPADTTILTEIHGTTDIFGRAYGRQAGSPDADPFGNSRPFQTEPCLTPIVGRDFFGIQSSNVAYLEGPVQDLTNSPSYPSGHTTYGYTDGLLLAILVPHRYPQMITRAAEYGNNRIILGAHYAMDVIGGRTLALYDMAQLLANKPGYVGVKRGEVEIDDFRHEVELARIDVTKSLEARRGSKVALCTQRDQSRFADRAKDRASYESTQTYGLPVVFKDKAGRTEDVGKLAPEAGYLLTAAFPSLTLAEADAILTETEGPGGGFLDNGSVFGIYSRLDLYKASEKAAALVQSRQ